jgi:Tfp pilus assembly pilus retraction ATPase PilT
VIQRELGTHLRSFADGLRAALREDPDVILVGELRDAETISMAMTAAETGHLVLGTLHTTGAVKTIDRILDALPIDLREQTKSFLSQSLNAVVSQVLVKNTDGRGRKAILEIMVMNRAIAKLIGTDQTHQIPSIVQTNRNEGMQLMDPGAAGCRAGEADRSGRRLPVRREQAAVRALRHGPQSPAAGGASRRGAYVSEIVIDELLKQMMARKGSDLHLVAGDPPRVRLYGDLQTLEPTKLTPDQLKDALYTIMPARAKQRFEAEEGADFAHAIQGLAPLPRKRAAAPRRHRRRVPRHPSQRALASSSSRCPRSCARSAARSRGSCWYTGKTGSGKSTTLAAMLDSINTEMKGHIITIEDPIEFTHERKAASSASARVGATRPPSLMPCTPRCARTPTSSSWARCATSRR